MQTASPKWCVLISTDRGLIENRKRMTLLNDRIKLLTKTDEFVNFVGFPMFSKLSKTKKGGVVFNGDDLELKDQLVSGYEEESTVRLSSSKTALACYEEKEVVFLEEDFCLALINLDLMEENNYPVVLEHLVKKEEVIIS